jgi:hypothetical protein
MATTPTNNFLSALATAPEDDYLLIEKIGEGSFGIDFRIHIVGSNICIGEVYLA